MGRPPLTARDIADLIDLSYVKGRLPDNKGFQIESYEVLFRDHDGKITPLSKTPAPYTYETRKQGYVGEMIVAMKIENKMVEITVIAHNDGGSQKSRYQLKLPENCMMVCNHEFKGRTGDTDKDFNYVVEIGDNEVFTFPQSGAAPGEKPAAIILRTHAKLAQSASAK